MSENSWPESEQNELDPFSSFLGEWSDPEDEEEEFRSDFFQGLEGRRRKAALTLMLIWGVVIGLHLLSWGFWLVLSLTSILLLQGLRMILASPEADPEFLRDSDLSAAPFVSLLVAAKNEEAVITQLVRMLCNLDYPRDKYELWVVDDYSTDRTPVLLKELAREYPQLKVLHRSAGAGGGKSGALNQVLPLTSGELIAVFDADAIVSADLLRWVVPLFKQENTGAVQVRKAIANASENFWTRGQAAEMALDGYLQRQRIALGGIGELRGNGQFVRRSALQSCGGWNEQTITDDLDLTLRLHLDNWKIGSLQFPPVQEEGVTRALALWHQRNRWAEGGYQRYLDYWRPIANNRMGLGKTWEMLSVVLIQYILPAATIPDLMMALIRHRSPLLYPVGSLGTFLIFWGMYRGLRRLQPAEESGLATTLISLLQTCRGVIYMSHWMIVMSITVARMSVRPKRLKWVKTVHEGSYVET